MPTTALVALAFLLHCPGFSSSSLNSSGLVVNIFKLIDSTRVLLGDVSSSLIFHCFHSVPNRTWIAMRGYFFSFIIVSLTLLCGLFADLDACYSKQRPWSSQRSGWECCDCYELKHCHDFKLDKPSLRPVDQWSSDLRWPRFPDAILSPAYSIRGFQVT